jgi:homoserine O-acetyltransferase
MESILESSDDFYSDLYTDSLSRMPFSVCKKLYSNYFSKKMFQTMSNDEIDVLMDDFVDEGLFVDVYDFKFRNDCVMEYNVEDKLGNITADALIISSNNDMYYTPEFDLLPLNDLMKNVTVVLFEDENSYFDYDDCSIVETEINSFMEKIKNK